MEQGGRADALALRLECSTPSKLGVFQIIDGGEVLVDQRGIGQWPEVLGRLQFGRVRRQKVQVDVVRDARVDAGMPPARSCPSTICLVGLAPTWRANSANATSNTGMLTVVAR